MSAFHPASDPLTRALLVRDVHMGLTDHACAVALGVSASTVWPWRLVCGIAPADQGTRCLYHWTATEGLDAVARFRRLLTRGASMAAMAQQCGFTRQRAHQIARQLQALR